MKKQLLVTFASLSLLCALAVVSVQAQSRNRIKAHVPFAFQIGDKTLPAGEYSVKNLTQTTMLVQSADGETSVIAQGAGSVQNKQDGQPITEKLVFRQYGDQYFLAQVWLVRDEAGRELYMSDAERKAASDLKLARHGAKPQMVAIAAQ